MAPVARVVLHIRDGLREVVDPDDVYLLEALEESTKVRLRRRRPLIDVRKMSEVLPAFEGFGFLQIHRSFAVNLHRVRQIRRRDGGRDWELRLESPVNRIVPVSRERYQVLLRELGSSDGTRARLGFE